MKRKFRETLERYENKLMKRRVKSMRKKDGLKGYLVQRRNLKYNFMSAFYS